MATRPSFRLRICATALRCSCVIVLIALTYNAVHMLLHIIFSKRKPQEENYLDPILLLVPRSRAIYRCKTKWIQEGSLLNHDGMPC